MILDYQRQNPLDPQDPPVGQHGQVWYKYKLKEKGLVFSFQRMAGQYFVGMAQSGLVSAWDASPEKITKRPELMSSFIKYNNCDINILR